MDDEEAIIRMAGLLLSGLGFEVEVARDGFRNCAKIRRPRTRPDGRSISW